MEISAQKYGLTNQKTVEFSQKLDLVVNEFMMIKYSEVNKQERLGQQLMSNRSFQKSSISLKTVEKSSERKRNNCRQAKKSVKLPIKQLKILRSIGIR